VASWWVRSAVLAVAIALVPFAAWAQGPSSNPPPAVSDQPLLKPEELEALVAPVALYPDTLLAEVLMASTYPLEVVQADRWAKANKNLKDDQLKAAVAKQNWDDSVKALVATPSVLDMMSAKLDWTQKLGDAVLAQQPGRRGRGRQDPRSPVTPNRWRYGFGREEDVAYGSIGRWRVSYAPNSGYIDASRYERIGDREAEALRCLEVDDKLEFRLRHRQVGRLFAL
jgi:hypothetical protein